MTESPILTKIRVQASRLGARLFRNSTGQAWTGKVSRLDSRRIIIEEPRKVVYGLCVGGSDLIGWQPVKITASMVGKTIAVFVAVEVKVGKTATTDAQIAFIDAVRAAGGLAGIARSVEEAEEILNG